jgi:uncharacterized protein (DUF1684 family)
MVLNIAATLAIAALLCAPSPGGAQQEADAGSNYVEQVTQWRQQRENGLKSSGGWLTVAGLYWLKEGDNSIGTGADNAVVLPAGSASAKVGTAVLHEGKVTLNLTEGVKATLKGEPVTTVAMRSDKDGAADRVVVNDLTLTIIVRGQRIGIRLYDNNAKTRTEFTGLKWYPVDPNYRVRAKFVPYDAGRAIPITNILGDTEATPSPGYVSFNLRGKEYRLEALTEGDGLFLIFRDQTTGKTTYHSGRFLNTPKPENGYVTLDFNEAYNPPCAFTAFATCPLPPRQNYLPIAIPAGEKLYHEHH